METTPKWDSAVANLEPVVKQNNRRSDTAIGSFSFG
jgi:hypothetical protein